MVFGVFVGAALGKEPPFDPMNATTSNKASDINIYQPCPAIGGNCILVELFLSNLHRNHMKHRTIFKAMCPITGEIL